MYQKGRTKLDTLFGWRQSCTGVWVHEVHNYVHFINILQPFWPQGTGCARGFLSAMDAAWMIRNAGLNKGVLDLLSERESLFQRLTQTKPENMMKKFSAYTIDPRTRYSNLNMVVSQYPIICYSY